MKPSTFKSRKARLGTEEGNRTWKRTNPKQANLGRKKGEQLLRRTSASSGDCGEVALGFQVRVQRESTAPFCQHRVQLSAVTGGKKKKNPCKEVLTVKEKNLHLSFSREERIHKPQGFPLGIVLPMTTACICNSKPACCVPAGTLCWEDWRLPQTRERTDWVLLIMIRFPTPPPGQEALPSFLSAYLPLPKGWWGDLGMDSTLSQSLTKQMLSAEIQAEQEDVQAKDSL